MHDKDPRGLLGTEGRGVVRAQEGMLSIRKGTGTPGSLLHVCCFIRVPGAQAFLLFCPGNRHEMLHFCSSEISSRGKLTLSASLLNCSLLIGPAWVRCHPGPINCAPQQLGGGR